MPDQYLSTDPNAGQAGGYLSTDPNAGVAKPTGAARNAPSMDPNPLNRIGRSVIDAVKRHPVEVMATLGGLAVAPFTGGASLLTGLAGAGLGAAGGAGAGIAARQLGTGRPESAMDTLKTMIAQGAGGVVGEGAGRAVAGAANLVVPKVLKGILRPGKGIQQEFGDVTGVMRRERIPVGKSEIAQARMSASAGRADDAITAAEQAGAPPVSVREVAQEVRPVRDTAKLRVKLGKPDETPMIAGRVRAMRAANPNGIPLTEAQTLKREAQDAASRTFRAIDRGNVVNDAEALTDKAIATGLRKSIETRVPEVAPINQRTQQLMGLTKALEDAEARSGGVVGLNPANWISGLAPGLGSKLTFAADTAGQSMRNPTGLTLQRALIAALLGEQGAEGPR
jgi:hypothetical protein